MTGRNMTEQTTGRAKRLPLVNFKGWPMTVIALAVLAVGYTAMGFVLLPTPLSSVPGLLAASPLVLLLNLFAVSLLLALCYFATNRVWISSLVSGLAVFLLFAVNRYKIQYRVDPLTAMDFFIGREAFSIVGSSDIQISPIVIAIGVFVVLFSLALMLVGFRRVKPAARGIGAGACVLAAVLSYVFVYSNAAVYDSMPINGNVFNAVDEYNSRGFLPSFLYSFSQFEVKKPQGYAKAEAESLLDNQSIRAYSGMEEKPDVFVIMSEAFWDMSDADNLAFESYPAPTYKKLTEEAISGDLYVSAYGGGTDSTEFSVLTGFAAWNSNLSLPSPYKFFIRRDLGSIAWLMKNNGYNPIAIHPGMGWFYNRNNVYEWLGFDEFITQDFFAADDIKGNYVSDAALADKIISRYEIHREEKPDTPYFNFVVTIQNHGPYDAGPIYGADMEKNYGTAGGLELSPTSDTIMRNYVQGISDADAALTELHDYFDSLDRPVVLMYFGDHMPMLGGEYLTYNELGYGVGFRQGIEAIRNTYRTGYFIWANEECRDNWPEYADLTDDKKDLSANNLGVYLMDILGMELDSQFSFMRDTYPELPVITPWFYKAEDGSFREMDDFTRAKLRDYSFVQHYLMFDQ